MDQNQEPRALSSDGAGTTPNPQPSPAQPSSNMATPNTFGSSESSPIPPPPIEQQKVGVRSMESDLSSVKTSGGEQPQTQIVDAPKLVKNDSLSSLSQPSFGSPSTQSMPSTPPIPQQPPMPQRPPMPPMGDVPAQVPLPESAPADASTISSDQLDAQAVASASPRPSLIKTILIVVAILIGAGIVGYGAYYLVTSLNSTPEIQPITQQPTTPSVPETQPVQETPAPTPTPAVFSSLYGSAVPAIASTVVVTPNMNIVDFHNAITSVPAGRLANETTEGISFTDEQGAPLTSSAMLGTLFPSASPTLSSSLDSSFASWLYMDDNGSLQLGLVLPFVVGIDQSDAFSTAQASLEQNPAELANVFLSPATVPASPAFKEGVVDEVNVHFLAFSVANNQVFEYGVYNSGTTRYLIITSSYPQMVDILKQLKPALSTQ